MSIFTAASVDGVFEAAETADEAEGAVFHAASGLDAGVIAEVQALVRRRILARLCQSRLD